jgi:hypothetical protein
MAITNAGNFHQATGQPLVRAALQRRHRLDGVRAADGLRPGFRQPEMLHLARTNQLLHRPGYVLDGHVRVNPMLIEQINRFEP